ncbi:hypothetical protein J1614_006654, partial [Plenodomus biglobosus]
LGRDTKKHSKKSRSTRRTLTHGSNTEKSWQEDAMAKPEDQRCQHNFIRWIQALQHADALIYQVSRLCDSAPAWRQRWSPVTPYEMQRAYDCVYAHALGLIDDELAAPERVLELLQGQLTKSRKAFAELTGNARRFNSTYVACGLSLFRRCTPSLYPVSNESEETAVLQHAQEWLQPEPSEVGESLVHNSFVHTCHTPHHQIKPIIIPYPQAFTHSSFTFSKGNTTNHEPCSANISITYPRTGPQAIQPLRKVTVPPHPLTPSNPQNTK